MSKIISTIQDEKYRVPAVASLVGICCLLTYYFHWVLGIEVVFSHFFYIPIILAAVWWKRKGLVVAIFLALLLIDSYSLSHLGLDWNFVSNLTRATLFIVIGTVVSILSERRERAENRLSGYAENLERMVEERTRHLKETKDYLNNLIRYANAPIIVWNPANKITIFNQAFENLSGRTEAEMMGQPLDVLFPEESRFDSVQKIENASKGEYWETVEIPILRRDGETRLALWNSANIYAEDSTTLLATIAQGQDITERKRAEEKRQYIERLVNNSQVILFHWLAEPGWPVTFVSEGISQFGYTADDFYSRRLDYAQIIYPEDIPRVSDEVKAYLESRTDRFTQEYRIVTKSGDARWLDDRTLVVRTHSGNIDHIEGTILDITKRKRAEEKLKESEEFSRVLFDYIPIETIVVNTKGEIINFNLTKKKSGDRLPNVGDIMYKDYADKHEINMHAELMECIRSGETKEFPEQKYGSKFLSITIAPFPQGAILTSQDITERKLSEEEIKKLSSAVEQSNDGMAIVTLEEKLIYVNNAFAKMHGYSAKEMIGMKVLDLHNDEQQDEVKKRLKQIKTHGEWVGEFSRMRKDGTVFPTQMSVTLLKDAKGQITNMLAICRDTSEHKFVEEALISSEERYRELWDNAPVAYHILDTKGIITSVNHTEAKMLGYKPEQMLGKPIFEFVLPEQQAEAKQRFLQKIAGKHIPEAKERIYLSKGGEKIYVSIEDILEYDSEGKINGIRTTMLDITYRQRAEEEREESFQKLQKVFEEMITAFVSAVEIRDLYTAGHQKRVAELACAIAEEMKLSHGQIEAIRMAGLVHDIGKIAIPAEILGKPSKLTEIEMDLVKTHSAIGYDILKTIEFPWPVAKIVLQHHERIDGSGYPNGLKGDKILHEARILSVADVVEAMITYRPYREALGVNAALNEISKNKGKLYDPKVVDVCIELFKEKKFKFKKQ